MLSHRLDDRAEWFTPGKETTIGLSVQWVWESLWASTTCSISHILSHLRGHISSGPQPNYFTTRLTAIKRCTAGVQGSCTEPGCCHGHCHSADFQGWEEIRRALWLVCCTILTNRDRSSTHNNDRHCCYAIEQLEYAHLWILAGFLLLNWKHDSKSGRRKFVVSLPRLHIRSTMN